MHSEFEVLHTPDSNILCFRYVGDRRADDETLDAINREIRERYNRSGQAGSRQRCSVVDASFA